MAASKIKIVGQLVVGPGEADRYLEDTLREFHRLTDDAIAVTCNATKKELKLLDKYDIRHYEDNREWGRFQPDIKTSLLNRLIRLNPHWILALDSDETVPTLKRNTLEEISQDREAVQLYVINLWNDEQHYAKGMGFWNVRFYKADESRGVQFLKRPVHCGNAPPYFYTRPPKQSYVPHILLHKGLMLPSDRAKKAERYRIYDPTGQHKNWDYDEYYEKLVATGTGTEYNQGVVLQRIQEYCAKL